MKITLWVFTGGCRHFADEITSQVFTTREEADAAEAKWLEPNADYDESDEDDDYDSPYFGFVEKIEIDYPTTHGKEN